MPKKERKQYSIDIEIFDTIKDLRWGEKLPEDFPFDKTFGRIPRLHLSLPILLNKDLLTKLRKRDLQRFYLSRYGENTPRGSSVEKIIKMFLLKEELQTLGDQKKKLEETPIYTLKKNPWSEDLPNREQSVENTQKAFRDYKNLKATSLEEKIAELQKQNDIILTLLCKPLIASKALGVALDEQISRLEEIPQDLRELSQLDTINLLQSFDVPRSFNVTTDKVSLTKRKAQLLSIKTVAENYGLGFKEAESCLNCHKATGLPMEKVIQFLLKNV